MAWSKIEEIKFKKKFEKILKCSISPEKLSSGLPNQFAEYIKYCKNLEFEQEPNYNYLRNLFIEIINSNLKMMRVDAKNRIQQLHPEETNLAKAFLDEYDLIQDKKSFLTKGQRDQIVGFVGMCMIQMAKGSE